MENSSAEDAKDLFTNPSNDTKDASKEGDQKPAPAKKRTRKRIKVEAPVQENKNEEAIIYKGLRKTYGFENLGTTITGKRADTHFGHYF